MREIVRSLINRLLIFGTIFLFGCFGQSVPEIASDNDQRKIEDVTKGNACLVYSELVFNKALSYQAVLSMFLCKGWDKGPEGLPHFFEAIKQIGEAKWNHLFMPINNELFNKANVKKRDLLFKYIRDLDKENGLDDLGTVISALNEVNFFDALAKIFSCADDGVESCPKDKQDKRLSKKEIIDVFKIINIDDVTTKNLSGFFKGINKAVSANIDSYKNEYNKILADDLGGENFRTVRKELIDEVAEKVIDGGITNLDRNFIQRAMLFTKAGDDLPWISKWFKQEEVTSDVVKRLIMFPVEEYPTMENDFKVINSKYNDDVTCEFKSVRDDLIISINFKNQLENYVEKIVYENKDDFYEFLLGQMSQLVTASSFCPSYVDIKRKINEDGRVHSVNMFNLINRLNKFMEEDLFFDLSRMILYFSLGENRNNNIDKLYLLDFFAKDIFSKLNRLNTVIIHNSPRMFDELLAVFKGFGVESFDAFATIFMSATELESVAELSSAAKLWHFYDKDEQEYLLNFIDRHFSNDINTVELLKFYTNLLDLFAGSLPQIAKNLVGDETSINKTYDAAKTFIESLKGQDVLNDFRRFYSRDQILKVIEIISKNTGSGFNVEDNSGFISNYKDKMTDQKFKFDFSFGSNEEAKKKSKCITEISSKGLTLQDAIVGLPDQCLNIESDEFAFTVLFWLNYINKDFTKIKRLTTSENVRGHFLDDSGIIAPRMINNFVGIVKLLDDALKTDGDGGLRYLVESVQFHLYELGGSGQVGLYDSAISIFSQLLQELPSNHAQFRVSLLSEFVKDENYSKIVDVIGSGGKVLGDYGKYVKESASVQSQYEYDPKYSCNQFLETGVSGGKAGTVCPDARTIKIVTRNILKKIKVDFENDNSSFAGQLLQAMIPGSGIEVPYNVKFKKAENFRVSLKELAEMFYVSLDKSLPENRKIVEYASEDDNRSREEDDGIRTKQYTLSTLERVETTVREVGFDRNYLGSSYMNAIASSDDYVGTSEAKLGLLKKCKSVKFCGRWLSKDEVRMAKNAISSFPGLMDIEREFEKGKMMQSLLVCAVSSSGKDVRMPRLLPYTQEELERHNGQIITNIASIGGMTNIGRFLHDRVGRTNEEFKNFINSKQFLRVSDRLLANFPVATTKERVESIVDNILATTNQHGDSIVDALIDWLSGLSYNDLRLVEETVGNVAVVSTYLGSESDVYGVNSNNSSYESNDLFSMFDSIDLVVSLWPVVQKLFPQDVPLIDVVRPLNNIFKFLKEKLLASRDARDSYYVVLNGIYSMVRNILLGPRDNFKGLDFVLSLSKNKPAVIEKFLSTIRGFYNYLDLLHGVGENSGKWFVNISQKISLIPLEDVLASRPVQDYLKYTTIPYLSEGTSGYVVSNYHYDELASVLFYLEKQDGKTKRSNFVMALDSIFKKEIDNITRLIDEFSSILTVKR